MDSEHGSAVNAACLPFPLPQKKKARRWVSVGFEGGAFMALITQPLTILLLLLAAVRSVVFVSR